MPDVTGNVKDLITFLPLQHPQRPESASPSLRPMEGKSKEKSIKLTNKLKMTHFIAIEQNREFILIDTIYFQIHLALFIMIRYFRMCYDILIVTLAFHSINNTAYC